MRVDEVTGELTVGQLASRTRVPADTVRFYEREGLLPIPQRTEGEHRRYGPTDVDRLLFIRGAQRLGLRLAGRRMPLAAGPATGLSGRKDQPGPPAGSGDGPVRAAAPCRARPAVGPRSRPGALRAGMHLRGRSRPGPRPDPSRSPAVGLLARQRRPGLPDRTVAGAGRGRDIGRARQRHGKAHAARRSGDDHRRGCAVRGRGRGLACPAQPDLTARQRIDPGVYLHASGSAGESLYVSGRSCGHDHGGTPGHRHQSTNWSTVQARTG